MKNPVVQSWQDRFLSNHDTLRDVPTIARRTPTTKGDIQRNIAQLLGDTIETMDTMIAYRSKLQPKVAAMLKAGVEWDELNTLNDCLDQMEGMRGQLLQARPLHRLISAVATPTVAFRTAMKHSDAIHDNATELCGSLLTLHHAAEALKQRILLDTAKLTNKQKDITVKFASTLAKIKAEPHSEAQTLAAAALVAAHDMRAMDITSKNQKG